MLATDHAITISLVKLFPVLIVGFISFMGLGLLLGAKLTQKRKLSDYFIVIFAYVIAALIGYIDFYIYLGSDRIGSAINTPLLIINVAAFIYLLLNSSLRKIVLRRVVWLPIALILLVGMLYIGVLDSCTVHQISQKRYYCLLPDTSQSSQTLQSKIVFDTFDNLIPYYFAQNVEAGHARVEYGDWKSSDRPPLQTGMYLAYNSAANWFIKDPFSSYLMLTMLFQLAAIPAVIALLKVLKCNEKQISIVILALIFTDFFFNNTYFTWPKLLAAAMFLLGFLLLLEKKQLTPLRSVIIGVSLALSYLAHSAVAFSVVPLFIIVIPRIKTIFKLKYLAVILASVIILLTPWLAYQTYYDPPGNRLLKWQFAGDIPIDNHTVAYDIMHAYEKLTPITYLKGKEQNTTVIIGSAGFTNSGLQKNLQVESLGGAGGLMILSLVGFIYVRRKDNKTGWQAIKKLSLYIVTTLILWGLLMFIPGSTSLHQGSYVVPLMFIALLGIFASFLPYLIVIALLISQSVLFFCTWIFYKGFYDSTGAIRNQHAIVVVVLMTIIIYGLLFFPIVRPDKSKQGLKAKI